MAIKAAHLNLDFIFLVLAIHFCEIALAFEWFYFQYVFMGKMSIFLDGGDSCVVPNILYIHIFCI